MSFLQTAIGRVSLSIEQAGNQLKKAREYATEILVQPPKHVSEEVDLYEDQAIGGGRRLVVCIDGTGDSPGSSVDGESQGGLKKSSSALVPSNIVKIAYLLGNGANEHDADSGAVLQKIYYHSGVATENNKKQAKLESHFGNIHEHLLDAYAWLAKEYREGDEIYAFGFSRGATIVRSLFSFIRYAGLVRISEYANHDAMMESVYAAFDLYKTRLHQDNIEKVKAFHEQHCHHHVYLKFIGVFDTIEALNVPEGYSKLIPSSILTEFEKSIGAIEPNDYHDLRIGPNIPFAYHALSLDENREFFPPTLFEAIEEEQILPGFHREQKWFRGTHADIGGGTFWEHGLSDISLSWMIEKARAAGLVVRNLESFDAYISPLLMGLSREYYHSRKERKLHDYYVIRPGSKTFGERTPRDLKYFMEEKKLFYASSLHESVSVSFEE
ncbi:UNVERIFIED_CONTAM: hypothetical protein HDU68_007853 [Siphonaria sp. JEL0065]|nr:hypothetical protein HDU68_007853 [Siphonaria sp. JEL0065]